MINQQKAKEAYDLFVQKAKDDDRILGVVLSGGRGKGAQTENSDYDVMLITTDDGFEGVKADYQKTEFVDSLPHSISEFREYAKTGSRSQYDKYTFAHNQAIVDKTGEIQKLVNEKGLIEPDQINRIVRDALGGYLNSLYRALKNLRDGDILAGHLDADETIPRILTFIFAIEGRVRPFNKFLEWELNNHPLSKLPIETKDFLQKIEKIISLADLEVQKEVLEMVKKMAVDSGYSDKIAEWEGYYFG